MTWKPPQNVGDRSPAVADAKRALRKYSYGRTLDGGGKELWPLFTAIANGVRFLGSMGPHGAYNLEPCIEFCRQRLG